MSATAETKPETKPEQHKPEITEAGRASGELARLEERVKDRGHSTADKQRARDLAKTAGIAAPKWAKATGKQKTEPKREPQSGPREGSGLWAVIQVLKSANGPLTPKETFDRIKRRKLATGLKGATPEQTIAASMAVAAKKGQHDIVRTSPGHFWLGSKAKKAGGSK